MKSKSKGLGRCDTHVARVSPCTRKPVENRMWAGHCLKFCDYHAGIWDDTVTYALTDFYQEYCPEKYYARAA